MTLVRRANTSRLFPLRCLVFLLAASCVTCSAYGATDAELCQNVLEEFLNGRIDAALAKCEKQATSHPKVAATHTALGCACLLKGSHELAYSKYVQGMLLQTPGAVFDDEYLLEKARVEVNDANGRSYLSRAISEFEKALQINPTNAVALGLHAEACVLMGDSDKAIESYKKAFDIDPGRSPALSGLVNQYHLKGKYAEAISACEQALAANPSNGVAYMELGQTYADQRQYENAIEACRQAVAIYPDFSTTHTILGKVYWQAGKLSDAEQELNKAIALNPADLTAHNNLGIVFKRRKQYDKAIAEYQAVLAADPNHAPAHSNLGTVFFHQSSYADAEREAKTALALDPNLAEAHNILGQTYQWTGRAKEGLPELQKACELDPLEPIYWYSLSWCYKNNGSMDKAVECMEKARDLAPKEASYWDDVGYFNIQMGMVEKGAECEKRALQLDPRMAVAHVNLAWMHSLSQTWDASIREMEQAVSMEPENADYQARLGAAYGDKIGLWTTNGVLWRLPVQVRTKEGELQWLDKSEEALKKSLALNPTNSAIHYSLAVVYEKKNMPDKALVELETAVAGDPENILCRRILGEAYRGAGRFADAIREHERVLIVSTNRSVDMAVLADDYFAQGDANHTNAEPWNKAAELYQKLISLDSNNVFALNSLGWLYLQQGDSTGSIAVLSRAVELDPKMADAHGNLANAYLASGHTDKARIHCQRSLDLGSMPDLFVVVQLARDSDGKVVDTQLVNTAFAACSNAIASSPSESSNWRELGLGFVAMNDSANAEQAFRKALELRPDDADTLDELGVILFNKNNYDEAIEVLKKATAINPRLVRAHGGLGIAYGVKGMHEAAIVEFKQAVQNNPDYADGYYSMALSYYALQQYENARQSCKKAMELGYPADPRFVTEINQR